MRRILGAGILSALALAASAHASSDAAWREFDARVRRACTAASGFAHPRLSTIVGFDDRVGAVAMLVTDRRAPARARLCLYDKRARRAWMDAADGWSAPTR